MSVVRKQVVLDAGPVDARREAPLGMRVGWIAHLKDGMPWVDFEENTAGPIPVRLSCVSLDSLRAAEPLCQRVVLMFDEDSSMPVLLGLIHPPLPMAREQEVPAPVPARSVVEGKRVVISAEEGLTLRCGGATVTLDSLGGIRIEGEQIETRAVHVNRIQGDEVELN